ncbi:MAG: hypothetical protein OEZ68_03690 [Gammaproteobacteria bacterium]|nr:hypothetical protein [Gammaproteobacteria bacterium]MDH5799887.1 hypothetical protein [Gammaproteobacteria bacterium]
MHNSSQQEQHPDLESLSGFVMQPDHPDFQKLSVHLAQCPRCRQQAGTLSAIRSRLSDGSLQPDDTATYRIEAYVDKLLDDEEVQKQLQKNPATLKAALHYASHSTAMKRALAAHTPLKPQQHSGTQRTGILETLKQALCLRPPLWANALAATALIAVTVLLVPTLQNPSGHSEPQLAKVTAFTVATYQDSDKIFYQEHAKPGIGFFGQAAKISKPYASMQVSASDNALVLQWPTVAKADSYHITLQLVKSEERTLIGEKQSKVNQVTFSNHKPVSGYRYEWTLSGKTMDAQSFYTHGGFVINKHTE